jgi:hypothetical protein
VKNDTSRRSTFVKRLIAFLFVAAFSSQTALWAEDNSKVDIFGGFSTLTVTPKFAGNTVTAQGWQAGVAIPLGDLLSLVGDGGGQYRDGNWAYEYLGGIQVNRRTPTTTLFVHALYGYATGGGNVPSQTSFMMGYGAGFDVKVHERISFRVIQFDWLPSNDLGIWQTKQFRAGFGAVYHIKSED